MKKFYRISGNVNSSLLHLGESIVLAFVIMMFVNLFIGGMGGIPVFAGFLLEFYLLRATVIAGNRISHQLALESRTEVRYYFANYALGYLLVWGLMKILILLSRVSGWGYINGISLGEYMDRIYGSTMLERWAYLFAGILMFAYAMSLFPLIMIPKKRIWIWYLVCDGFIFSMICGAIVLLCRWFFIAPEKRRKIHCVLDALLLCELPEPWAVVCYLVGLLIFLGVVLWAAYRISVKCYCPGPAVMEWKEQPVRSWKDYKGTLIVTSLIVVIVTAGLGYFLFATGEHEANYQKVAECLTEDNVLGPMVYRDEIYVPVEADWNLAENGKPLGYLGYREENCDSRFYELVIANTLYQDPVAGDSCLQMQGADFGRYERLDKVTAEEKWKSDSVFVLWDEDWVSQTAYSNATGYSVCGQQLMMNLMEQYPDVSCRQEDFTDYDAYFTLRSYPDMKTAFEEEGHVGNWVGCILVKDNKFYFGNYDNRIQGESLQQLLDVLGGN